MIFNSDKERAIEVTLAKLALYANDVAHNRALSLEERMKTIQWLCRGYTATNKALIKLKTERINKNDT